MIPLLFGAVQNNASSSLNLVAAHTVTATDEKDASESAARNYRIRANEGQKDTNKGNRSVAEQRDIGRL